MKMDMHIGAISGSTYALMIRNFSVNTGGRKMTVRQIEPIDRAELRATIQKWIDAHTDVDDTDGVGLLEDVLWEINAQPTLTPPNEWVSVEDRLPASGQNVIATNGSDVGEAWYASLSRSWYRYNGLEWNRICREVTHWTPLPEPPGRRPTEGEV